MYFTFWLENGKPIETPEVEQEVEQEVEERIDEGLERAE